MQKLVWVNSKGTEINLTSGDYGITEWEGFSACDVEVQTQNVPFQDGSVFLDALLNNRELSVTLAINDGKDLEKRYRLRRELIAALNPKLGEGYLIYTNDFISKRIKCLAQMPVFPTHNSDKAGTPKASLSWTACDPYWEDLEETNIDFGIGSQPVINNEGDVPTQMKIDFFTSGVTNPKITNVKTNKFIEYNGNLSNGLHIDTNVGNKSVISENLNFDNLAKFPSMSFRCVYYSNIFDMVIVTGDSGWILTSNDVEHKNWTSRISGTNNTLLSITYSKNLGLFVITGVNGTILTSPDGINWTSRTSGVNVALRVTYSETLNLFVAVGLNGVILTSPDGINWTSRTSGTNDNLVSITYSENLGLFVAVGGYSNIITAESSDGVNWECRTQSRAGQLNSITYSENLGLFLAIGISGGKFITETSTDGINWTVSATEESARSLYSVVYSENLNLFVGVGTGYEGGYNHSAVATSSDGVNWEWNFLESYNLLNSITYSEILGEFFSCGEGSLILNSSNSQDWNINIYGGTQLNSMVYSDLLKIFVGVKNKEIYLSLDGINWNQQFYTSEELQVLRFVIYSENLGLFVVVGDRAIFTSPDGINWTSRMSGTQNSLRSVVYSEFKNLFVATGDNGIILTSPDGINWTSQTSGTNKILLSITYSEILKIFVAVGENGIILTSINGITWNEVSNTSNDHYQSIVYSSNLGVFVAVGSHGHAIRSNNGLYWEEFNVTDIDNFLRSIIYVNELQLFITIGNNGMISISSNGIEWERKISGISNLLYSVVYSPESNTVIINGYGGTILTSYFSLAENQIKNISPDSDMNLNLQLGENKFRLNKTSGSFRARITYRQKYIGV